MKKPFSKARLRRPAGWLWADNRILNPPCQLYRLSSTRPCPLRHLLFSVTGQANGCKVP
jgi:hypothetical protein